MSHKFIKYVAPMHFTSLGSGIHCPVLAHLAMVGPLSRNPAEQLKVIFVPSNARSLYPVVTLIPESSEVKGESHSATTGH